MPRQIPMAPCLALLRSFDRQNPNPQQTIAAGAAAVEAELAEALDALNDGQFAAMIDFTIWKGADVFAASDICGWIKNGNLALPAKDLPTFGARGKAERDVWNRGADV